MKYSRSVPSVIICLSFLLVFPGTTSSFPPSSRLQEILTLPILQTADWQDLFSIAEEGDTEAQYWLGVIYDQGKLLPPDKEKSRFWLKKSAEHGYARAEFYLCHLHDRESRFGLGVCMSNGAKNGVPEAQFQMGLFFRSNELGITSEELAFDWFRKAAEGGNVDGEVELGIHYEMGDGVDQDFTQAA